MRGLPRGAFIQKVEVGAFYFNNSRTWFKKIAVVLLSAYVHYAGVKLREFSNIDINVLYRLLFHISKFECFDDIFAAGIKQLASKYCMDGLWNFGNAFSVQKLSDTW